MYPIIKQRKYTYVLSALLLGASVFSIASWGLNYGIDFTGGTIMEVQFGQGNTDQLNDEEEGEMELLIEGNTEEGMVEMSQTEEEEQHQEDMIPEVTQAMIIESLSDVELRSLTVQMSDENKAILKYVASDEEQNQDVLQKLQSLDESVTQLRVDFIGATISNQLRDSAGKALFLAIVTIALYIAWAFRKVSIPIPSWQYGLGAIAALTHDVVIVIGTFAFLGQFYGVEIGVPFIAALLTILGYSVNDTIVIYDRIRENLLRNKQKLPFDQVVNNAVNESLARSFNTSITVVFVLVGIILLGGETIKYFSIALLIGVIAGTYSSIFVASALLVSRYKWKKK